MQAGVSIPPYCPVARASGKSEMPAPAQWGVSQTSKIVGCECSLCIYGRPPCLSVSDPSWTTIVSVALYVLHQMYPVKQFFSLKSSVYPYVQAHWSDLMLPLKNTTKWKKQILDALSHSSPLFSTGQYVFFKTGYWGLKSFTNPWTTRRGMPTLDLDSPPQTSTIAAHTLCRRERRVSPPVRHYAPYERSDPRARESLPVHIPHPPAAAQPTYAPHCPAHVARHETVQNYFPCVPSSHAPPILPSFSELLRAIHYDTLFQDL